MPNLIHIHLKLILTILFVLIQSNFLLANNHPDFNVEKAIAHLDKIIVSTFTIDDTKRYKFVDSIPHEINEYDCVTATENFFDYQAIANTHAIFYLIDANRSFVINQESIQKNNRVGKKLNKYFEEGIAYFREKHPSLWRECAFDPRVYEISIKPLSGEDNSICFSAVNTYMAVRNTRGDSNQAIKSAEGQLENDVIFRTIIKPGGRVDQLKHKLIESCINTNIDNKDKTVNLYDIMVFNTLQEGQDFFESNKDFTSGIRQKEIPTIKKVQKNCNEAFHLIDSQADFWYKYLSAADAILANANFNNYTNYSYKIQQTHNTGTRIALSYVIRYAALVLAKDGYLNKNIEEFKNKCLCNKLRVNYESIFTKNVQNLSFAFGPNYDGTQGLGLLHHIENIMSLRKQEHFTIEK